MDNRSHTRRPVNELYRYKCRVAHSHRIEYPRIDEPPPDLAPWLRRLGLQMSDDMRPIPHRVAFNRLAAETDYLESANRSSRIGPHEHLPFRRSLFVLCHESLDVYLLGTSHEVLDSETTAEERVNGPPEAR